MSRGKSTPANFLSIADLSRITGQRRYVINYAIQTYGPEPSGRVGITRVWAASDLPKIRSALKRSARSPQRAHRSAEASTL